MWWILRSPWGRSFKALRENPIRAESLGLKIRRQTLLAFAIGSAFGGLAGAMQSPLVQFIEPHSFGLIHSLKILLMVVVGGAGYFFGPILGAAVVTGGGIFGKVTKVMDDRLQVEISDGVRVHVARGTISDVSVKGQPVKDDRGSKGAKRKKDDDDDDADFDTDGDDES